MMRFKAVEIGQRFSEDFTCEILTKVSNTMSQVYDASEGTVYINTRTGKPVEYEFPMDHEVELEDNQ
jgi:hypothetical protein